MYVYCTSFLIMNFPSRELSSQERALAMKVKLSGSGLDLHWLCLVTLKGLAILGLVPHLQREEVDRE